MLSQRDPEAPLPPPPCRRSLQGTLGQRGAGTLGAQVSPQALEVGAQRSVAGWKQAAGFLGSMMGAKKTDCGGQLGPEPLTRASGPMATFHPPTPCSHVQGTPACDIRGSAPPTDWTAVQEAPLPGSLRPRARCTAGQEDAQGAREDPPRSLLRLLLHQSLQTPPRAPDTRDGTPHPANPEKEQRF